MIRMATEADLSAIGKLLLQVLTVHERLRPDLFRRGSRKYSDEELLCILKDETRPIFVYEEDNAVLGYAFCKVVDHAGDPVTTGYKNIFVDDLCVDEAARGRGIGGELMRYVFEWARKGGAYNVTLNVWCGNEDAIRFYRALGMREQRLCMEIRLQGE